MPFGHGDDVGCDAQVLEGKREFAATEDARLNLVNNEKQAVLAAELSNVIERIGIPR